MRPARAPEWPPRRPRAATASRAPIAHRPAPPDGHRGRRRPGSSPGSTVPSAATGMGRDPGASRAAMGRCSSTRMRSPCGGGLPRPPAHARKGRPRPPGAGAPRGRAASWCRGRPGRAPPRTRGLPRAEAGDLDLAARQRAAGRGTSRGSPPPARRARPPREGSRPALTGREPGRRPRRSPARAPGVRPCRSPARAPGVGHPPHRPKARSVDLPQHLHLGLELDAEALPHAPAPLLHEREHVRRGGPAGVLHEVGVLLEKRAPRPRGPGTHGVEELARRPSPAPGSSGFLKVEPKVLIPDGWASRRRARIAARVAFTAWGGAGLSANEARATTSRAPRLERR